MIEEIKNEVHRLIKNSLFEEITSNVNTKIGGNQQHKVTGNVVRDVTGNVADTIGGDHSEKTTGKWSVKAQEIAFEADSAISFKVGGSHVIITTSSVGVQGSSSVVVKGGMVEINTSPPPSAKTATAPAACNVPPPKAKLEAMLPGQTGHKTYSGGGASGAATAQNAPAHPLPPTGTQPASSKVNNDSKDAKGEKPPENHFIEIELKDEDNLPVPGEYFEVITPEGTSATGTTDEKGFARIDGIQPGQATVRFPNRDKSVVD